jgi:hypothetical protein
VVWVILILNLVTILVSFKKRMLLYSLLNAIFLFLVVGQAIQIQSDLEISHSVVYLSNFISDVGFHVALWYVLGVTCVSLFLALASKGYRRGSRLEPRHRFDPGPRFYIGLFLFLCLLAFVLIFVVVGLSEFLHSSRPGFQSGSSIFIVLFFLGVMPMLLKILYKGKIGLGDIACLLVSVIVSGAFSRIHLILYLICILLAFYYSRGWADAEIKPLMLIKIVSFGAVCITAFFLIGALHDAQNFVQGSLGDLVEYILKHPEKSILSIEYNYRVGVEGMSGVAGIITQYVTDPNSVHFDLGVSWILKGPTEGMPAFLKAALDPVIEFSEGLIWYPCSVIATGVETFFMSFGWMGMVLYPLSTYLLAWYLPLRLLSTPISPPLRVFSYIALASSIFFVRGTLAVWIGFMFSYAVIILVFRPLFQMSISLTDPSLESMVIADGPGL